MCRVAWAWVAVSGRCHGVARATLCACRVRWIVDLCPRGLIESDLGADVTEVAKFVDLRRTYQAKVDAEMRLGKTRHCNTTRPNAGHKPVFGPRISSAAGNRFKVTWKKLVLARMQSFCGGPTQTLEFYLSVVMPEVWSALLARCEHGPLARA